MRIILVRHTSVDVPKGTCYGWTDVPVASTFEQEASKTKVNLSQYGRMDAVFSSPLTRARKLAAFCGYPQPQTDDRLKEMNMDEWEMRLYDEITAHDPRILEWYRDYMYLSCTGVESYHDVYRRVASFLVDTLRGPWQQVAVFAHAGVLVCAGVWGGLFSRDEAYENLVGYGGIEVVEK